MTDDAGEEKLGLRSHQGYKPKFNKSMFPAIEQSIHYYHASHTSKFYIHDSIGLVVSVSLVGLSFRNKNVEIE